MSRVAASMVANFLEFLGDAPEPEAGDEQKDKTQHKSLKECFEDALCPSGISLRVSEDIASVESLLRTIQELGL